MKSLGTRVALNTVIAIGAAALLSACTTAGPDGGQQGAGETFSGSVSRFVSGGDLMIRSNRGRTCWTTYRYSNRKGRGVFRCDDGQAGPFEFIVPETGGPASGTVTIAGTRYDMTIRS
ncbi:MAG: hypothetical protein AAF724_09535 [Pseudomonadota bacterium]